jgi:hypothetical protein
MERKPMKNQKDFGEDATMVSFSQASRRFLPGDRVVWDERQSGTVLRYLDDMTLAVRWDDQKLGSTMAPAWTSRLRRQVLDWPADDNSSDTLPGAPEFEDWSCA